MLHSLKNTRTKTEGDGDEARGRAINHILRSVCIIETSFHLPNSSWFRSKVYRNRKFGLLLTFIDATEELANWETTNCNLTYQL